MTDRPKPKAPIEVDVDHDPSHLSTSEKDQSPRECMEHALSEISEAADKAEQELTHLKTYGVLHYPPNKI